MSFQVYYPDSNCEDVAVEHSCTDCGEAEGARIRSVFFYKDDFVNPADTAEWNDGIAAGTIIVIAKTNGSYDGGTPKYGPGFGDTIETYINSEHKATFRDPDYKPNYDFYEGIKSSRTWKFGYVTENYVHTTGKTAVFTPKAPVVDDLTGQVLWEVEAKWVSRNNPKPWNKPDGIFDTCFDTREV